ncbi:MAG: hypothetical protein JKX84_00015, partial [Flavobacteriales bacterium]|nr:hypothetical protein [Flavobacteriales bacterium]
MRRILSYILVLPTLLAMGSVALGQTSCDGFFISDRFERLRPMNSRSNMECNFTDVRVMPVVIHVIHNGETEETGGNSTGPNLSTSDIISQLERTNNDLRKLNAPNGLYPGVATDVNLEFQLARSDPQGLPHDGIERINWLGLYPTAAPYSQAYIDYNIKPLTIWDPSKYLNIWIIPVVDGDGATIGGYANFPDETYLLGSSEQDWIVGLGDNLTDGIVIHYNTVNEVISGSTLTHELGHFLGLIHTFGFGNYEQSQTCSVDDYCDDTPLTAGYLITDPDSCQYDLPSCVPGTRTMTENFMDYVIPCQQIFTNDQKTRMWTSLFSPRRPTHQDYNSTEWYGLDTYEPNISASEASEVFPTLDQIIIDSTIESYIFHQYDQDWYRVEIQNSGVLNVNLESLPDNYDLEIYGPTGLSDWLDGDYQSGVASESVSYTATAATTVYIKVYGNSSSNYHRCATYDLQVLWQPAGSCTPVVMQVSSTAISASGMTDGTASVTVSAGTGPFTYLWSNGATDASLTGLGVGSYDVTVTGSDGCTATASVYVGVQGGQQPFCYGTTTLTAQSGSFSDGSSSDDYANNSACQWLIDPSINNAAVTLEFTSFQLHNSDAVNVYDGSNSGAPLIGSYTGNSLPAQITSTGATMYVSFVSNADLVAGGWSANYYSQILPDGVSIVQYEYWFDDDYANRTTTGVSPQPQLHLNTLLPTPNNLSQGLHSFHIRFKDDRGFWSSVLSQLVYRMNTTLGGNTNNIVAYEYWFDDDYIGTVDYNGISAQSPYVLLSDLDATTMSQGLHSLHIRFRDQADQWSSVVSQLFYKMNTLLNGNTNNVANYEYWFDDDHANAINQPANGQPMFQLSADLDASALNNGLHSFHIRFDDEAGQWSSVVSQLVYKMGNSLNAVNQIAAYRYWFDMDFANVVVQNVNPPIEQYILNDLIDASLLPSGEHVVHFQFQDLAQQWSSVLTDTFQAAAVPVANFTANPISLCNSGWVDFTNNSVNVDTYLWDFDDSNTSPDFEPSHFFATQGTYDVT